MSEETTQISDKVAKKVFISYSRLDYLDSSNKPISDSYVAKIVNALRGAGITVWLDVTANYTGEYFSRVLAKNILDSDIVVFLSSANSNESEWVSKEISYSIDNKKTIIPVKIDETKYNLDFALGLSGIEAVEYFRGEEAGLNKLLSSISKQDEQNNETNTKNRKITDFKGFVKRIFTATIICLIVMCIFATFGFYDGYSSTRLNAEEAIGEAFRTRKIIILNEHSIQYQGNTMTIVYDVSSGISKITSRESNFFDHITVKSILSAVSIPLAFEKLFLATKIVGDGKTKAAMLIGGSIGILCGYSLGVPIGEDNAKWHNENDIKAYFDRPSTKELISQYIENIYK